MNVYITYDRYEHNEWFHVYHIDTDKQRAIDHCKEVDLIDFISYGPDDCHSFQLQKVVMTPEEYGLLRTIVDNCDDTYDFFFDAIMTSIFDKSGWYHEDVLICSNGYDDVYDVIKYYCELHGLDYEDDDTRNDVQDLLFTCDELFISVLKEYINANY